MIDKYSKIIDAPYKKSNRHPHISLLNRSDQFAPFAALTGFDESIIDTGKVLVNKIKISSEKEEIINFTLDKLIKNKNCSIKITYFKAIKNKLGEYKNFLGKLIEIDDINHNIKLSDKTKILFKDIYEIEIIN